MEHVNEKVIPSNSEQSSVAVNNVISITDASQDINPNVGHLEIIGDAHVSTNSANLNREVVLGLFNLSRNQALRLSSESSAGSHDSRVVRTGSVNMPFTQYFHSSKVTPQANCPTEYSILQSDETWFRKDVVQRSPFINDSNLSGGRGLELFNQEVLILTPISNAQKHLHMYFKNLCSLDYPHHLISVVLGEDSSLDETYKEATKHAQKLRQNFKSIDIVRLKVRRTVHIKDTVMKLHIFFIFFS